MPVKPQPLVVERWLGFREQRRRVVFTRYVEPDAYYEKPRNMIVQWDSPQVKLVRQFHDLGVVQANPEEYASKYGPSLKDVSEMPDFVRDIRPPGGLTLASDLKTVYHVPELEGFYQQAHSIVFYI